MSPLCTFMYIYNIYSIQAIQFKFDKIDVEAAEVMDRCFYDNITLYDTYMSGIHNVYCNSTYSLLFQANKMSLQCHLIMIYL